MASNTGHTLNTNKWFLGQVPDNQNQFVKNSIWEDTHGDRVKVRIPGMHPMSSSDDTEVINDNLPWAIVAKPTTHGNRNNQSTGIWGGEWVIGFFMDEDCQIPVITQVLGNNLTEYELTESINGTTQGKRVTRYNSGLLAGPHQVLGATSAKTPVEIDKKFFEQAKTETEPVVINVNNLPPGLSIDSTGAVVNAGNQIIDFPDENGNITL